MDNLEKILEEFDELADKAHDFRGSFNVQERAFVKSFLTKVYKQAHEAGRQEAIEEMQNIDPVWLAECFHDFYEGFAKAKGWSTQEKSRVSFSELPKENKDTMICTASSVLVELIGKLLSSLKDKSK